LLHDSTRKAINLERKIIVKLLNLNYLDNGDNFGRRLTCKIGYSGKLWPHAATSTDGSERHNCRDTLVDFNGYAENADPIRFDHAEVA
jgi:hypothetical protein